MPQPVRIVVDDREPWEALPASLEALGVTVELERLEAGDYVVGPDTLVERKTVQGLHRSIESRRLWRQLAELRAACSWPFLLIEGDDIDNGLLGTAAIRGACLSIIEHGVPLLRAMDACDSAMWLHRLALRRQIGV